MPLIAELLFFLSTVFTGEEDFKLRGSLIERRA